MALQFTHDQMTALDGQLAARKAAELLALCESRHPERFQPYPHYLRQAMIVNGLLAASDCGFSFESCLRGFLDLQCAIAPQFHLHPVVGDQLARPASERERFHAMIDQVPEHVWQEIADADDDMGWFAPDRPQQQPLRAACRLFAARPGLRDALADAQWPDVFARAGQRANARGLASDAAVIPYVACAVLYGEGFDSVQGPSWARRLFADPQLGPSQQADLLRLRIALDHDCWV